MEGTLVSVLKEANHIGLQGLVEGKDGCALKMDNSISINSLRNLTAKTLEGCLPDQ
jgi:hypothetical protein